VKLEEIAINLYMCLKGMHPNPATWYTPTDTEKRDIDRAMNDAREYFEIED